ncbi:DUF4349 domain-containing protein [Erythrobacter sp. HKB08]|uniref:DUF4349 domain-containing protein n=1 Tax=Erythrobacter sp. HKB08 TaxID=2502843 RepID=UPI001008CEDB|nr:DUF4349 domain-containing protein [Erythrobacter sp. HKB08]
MRRELKAGFLGVVAAGALLAGCSDQSSEAMYEEAAVDMAEAPSEIAEMEASADAAVEASADPMASEVPSGDIPLNVPKIAYIYRYGFSLPGDNIAKLQQEHADLCEAQGPYTCRILSMDHEGETGEYARGTLQLAVAADKAREFGAKLSPEAEMLDGEQVTHSIEGEDLSKAIVDTEARLRARTVLRDRLLEVLKTRRGTVAELVEAERSVAQVNQEIDQARAWVKEMKSRVAYTRMNISYESSTPVAGDFLSPIQGAVGSLGSIFGFVIAALILLGAVLLPIGGIVYAGRAINRRMNPHPTEA